MTEPRQIGASLEETNARLRAKYGAGDGTGLELEPGEVDLSGMPAPEDIARMARRAHWARVVPSRFAWAELEQLDPRARPLVEEWAHRPGGTNLLLLGPVGTGKTHAALAAARARALAGDEVRFLPVVELLDELRPHGPEHAFAHLAEVDLLVIDDLGTERATDWTVEKLPALINRRYMEQRPIIATTNLETDALKEHLGERAYSRLTGEGSTAVRLAGVDRRRRP